jgi:transitional endoplasmic reticulum ATPase
MLLLITLLRCVADLENVCREAALNALREDIDIGTVAARHFQTALAVVPPSLTVSQLAEYDAMQKRWESAR